MLSSYGNGWRYRCKECFSNAAFLLLSPLFSENFFHMNFYIFFRIFISSCLPDTAIDALNYLWRGRQNCAECYAWASMLIPSLIASVVLIAPPLLPPLSTMLWRHRLGICLQFCFSQIAGCRRKATINSEISSHLKLYPKTEEILHEWIAYTFFSHTFKYEDTISKSMVEDFPAFHLPFNCCSRLNFHFSHAETTNILES